MLERTEEGRAVETQDGIKEEEAREWLWLWDADTATQGEEIELHTEEQLQHNRQPEASNRQTGCGAGPQTVVEPGVVLERGAHPEGNPKEGGKSNGHQGQLQRGRKAFPEVSEYRAASVDTRAQIAGSQLR